MPKEAEMLEYALTLDIKALIISLVIIFSVGLAIYSLIKKIQEVAGIETKSMRKRRIMEETIETLRNDVEEIRDDREALKNEL